MWEAKEGAAGLRDEVVVVGAVGAAPMACWLCIGGYNEYSLVDMKSVY